MTQPPQFAQKYRIKGNRLYETVAGKNGTFERLLQICMEFLLRFLCEHGGFAEDWCNEIAERFQQILYQLAAKQAESIDEENPTHIFIRNYVVGQLLTDEAHKVRYHVGKLFYPVHTSAEAEAKVAVPHKRWEATASQCVGTELQEIL